MLKEKRTEANADMERNRNLNRGWLFHLGDEPGADYMGWDDRAWHKVTLPHDWSVEHPFDRRHSSGTGYLPGGTAWYRKHFELEEETAGKRVRVTFGGVYKNASVWINSNYLGKRPYGYSTFTYDISAFVRPGENVLAVRVEHEETADSRWFTGSGIYRDVTLTVTDPCSFETDGVFISTEKLENGAAILRIRYEAADGDVFPFAVFAPDGSIADAGAGTEPKGEISLTVDDPLLWSPDDPVLYSLDCRVQKDGAITDTLRIPFGIRTIRFDGDTGFYLNDENIKLKGVCVHHDAGALGAAVPKEVWARRLEKLKSAGCNAIRTAHNPPDPHLLELCDEMGFLVMDEAFDEWEGPKNKWWQGHNVYPPKRFGYAADFPEWHRADLEAMVKRDRNHPSVILWSIGNEIDYPNDPYVTPLFDEVLGNNDANKPAAERRYDPKKPDASRLAVVARELCGIVHALDRTRPVTSALSFPELSNRTGYADALDVVGYNYKEQFYEEDHRKYPGRVIYGSENGKGAREWAFVRDNDYICGQFLWTGVDFLGECPGWPRRISQAGILDLAGYEKPNYWYRKAMWDEGGEPFARLSACPAAIRWSSPDAERRAWVKWKPFPRRPRRDGREEEPEIPEDPEHPVMRVGCVTNAKEAELFLNGVSLGKKNLAAEGDGYRVTWEVPYEDGELLVIAGEARDRLVTPGAAQRLTLAPVPLYEAGSDFYQIEISLLGEEGMPTAEDESVRIQLVGDGELMGIENGSPDDLTPYSSNTRRTFMGRAIAYIRARDEVTVYAESESGLRETVKIG